MHISYCHLWPVILYHIFPIFHIKHNARKKQIFEHEMCVLIFPTILSESFLLLGITEREIVINKVGLHVKYPSFLPNFNIISILHDRLLKNTQILNLVKIRQVGTELFHVE